MRKRSVFSRLAVVVLAMSAMLGTMGSAVAEYQAPEIAGLTWRGTFLIRNISDGRAYCLDAHVGNGGGNNSAVGLWECNRGSTMLWNVYDAGPRDTDVRIINHRWNRSLDYPAASNGGLGWQYVIYDLVHSPGQRFRLRYSTIPEPHYKIGTYLCDPVSNMQGFRVTNGAAVIQGTAIGHPAERWELVPA